MPEPHSSSAGILWLVKAYGAKAIGFLAAGALMLSIWPPKTFKEGMVRFSSAIACSMLFGDAALAAVAHFMPWMLEDSASTIRIGVYALAGGPVYMVLGFIARALEAGTANPLRIIELLRGSK